MKGKTSFFDRKRRMGLFLVFVILMSCTACGSKNEGGGTQKDGSFEVISAIDRSSVAETDIGVMFSAQTPDGKSVRFEGIGIAVTDEGLVMQPGSRLFSLDYIGHIHSITAGAVGVDPDSQEYGWEFGFACANSPSVDRLTLLKTALPYYVDYGTPMDVTSCQTGFVALSAASLNIAPITVDSLNIFYDESAPQVFLDDLDPAGEVSSLLTTHGIDWNADAVHTQVLSSPEMLAEKKMQDPNVIMSDLIAGIDHSTVVREGDVTFFSSVMSDGAVVRFEGFHIDVDESGVTIYPDSKITSLDALGKIYAYYPLIENHQSFSPDAYENINFGYGYTYSAAKTSVQRAYEVHTWEISGLQVHWANGETMMSTSIFEPNFVFVSGYSYGTESLVLSSLKTYYDPTQKVTAMSEVQFETGFTGYYMEGDIYDPSREETEDPYAFNPGFYLIVVPDAEGANPSGGYSIYSVPSAFYEIGAMRDANGNEVDKTEPLKVGNTLDITIGDFSLTLPLPIVERFEGATTMNDLVPYAFPTALGEMDTLVVPVVWADQTNMANEGTLDLFRKAIGRTVDADGNVVDHSDTEDERFSLSEYYDLASYGKMKITSFMTDWYYSDQNFADVWQASPDENYANGIMDWVRSSYPDMDWSRYDRDGNGYVDAMIILNAGVAPGDERFIISYSGAIHYRHTYCGDHAGTQDAPRVNGYVTVGYSWIQDDYSVLIHEYAHTLGLIDYYDVNYSGIDAVGKLDMQSGNCGDWNAYSKLAVGWMQPTVVEGLASGESVEYTIRASSLADDVILIPAAGKGYEGPFSEYVMVDLLTMDGANRYGTEVFGLNGVQGVRISHVDALMEKHIEEKESAIHSGTLTEYVIGTIRHANAYTGSERGVYNIEVIQAGGDNTFTDLKNLDVMLGADDLFYAGDSFRVDDYDEFFYNGLMDDGSAFGYTVTVVSIGTDENGVPQATVRITAD